jgi:hypothetical protein
MLFPNCEASMLQLPAASIVALLPDTVQMVGVIEAKLTASAEVDVAVSVSGVPTTWLGIAANVIVWLRWWTRKPWFTLAAAMYVPLPA